MMMWPTLGSFVLYLADLLIQGNRQAHDPARQMQKRLRLNIE
jgi:hypothetical protein